MPLTIDPDDTRRRIHELAWGGFVALDEIDWRITDEYLEPDTLTEEDAVWVGERAAEAARSKREAEASWPALVEWNRIEQLFEQVRVQRYLALHNAGNTSSDARSDARQAWMAAGGPHSGLLGYVYYHSQDVDRAVTSGKLLLGYGGVGPTADVRDANTFGLAECLRSLLKGAGLSYAWNGDTAERIDVQLGQWRKRSP